MGKTLEIRGADFSDSGITFSLLCNYNFTDYSPTEFVTQSYASFMPLPEYWRNIEGKIVVGFKVKFKSTGTFHVKKVNLTTLEASDYEVINVGSTGVKTLYLNKPFLVEENYGLAFITSGDAAVLYNSSEQYHDPNAVNTAFLARIGSGQTPITVNNQQLTIDVIYF